MGLKNLDKGKGPKLKKAPKVSPAGPVTSGRKWLRNMIFATLGAGVGAAALLWPEPEKPIPAVAAPPSRVPETSPRVIPTVDLQQPENMEQKTEELIAKVEEGFEKLEKILKPKIAALKNKTNKQKNGPRLERLIGEGKEIGMLDDANHFAYRAEDKADNAAFFVHLRRELALKPNFNPDNYLHLLSAAHEVAHSLHDIFMKQASLDSKGDLSIYEQFYSKKDSGEEHIIVDFEVSAFAIEIELLNLLLDDELRQIVFKNEMEQEFLEKARKKLNASSDIKELQTLGMLLNLAKFYYMPGSGGDSFPPLFVADIAGRYSKEGVKLFTLNDKGLPIPFN